MRLTREQADQLIAHAKAEMPGECCGVLGGRGGIVERVFPGRNIETDVHRYRLDPREQREIFRTLVDREWDLVGIYHSHPATEAWPSAIDIEGSVYYSDTAYVIVSLWDTTRPSIRAFFIRNGEVKEDVVQIVG